nr:PDR/VanB family oxidoreductase [Solimonas marina]
MIRQYSLCGFPGDTSSYRIAVLREPSSRGGSQAIHDGVSPGSKVRISVPRNHFALADNAPHSILLAGGIGITPILSMVEALNDAGQSFELHYCARSRDRCAFFDLLQAAPYCDRVRFYFNDDVSQARLDVDDLLAARRDDAHVYVCGPAGFIEHVVAAGRRRGFSDAQLHREFFAAQPVATRSADDAFEIRLQHSGRTLQVPADMTIAQVLSAHGVDVELSCEQGVCGTCLTSLLDGEADHRDFFQTEEERAEHKQIAICCSRARSPLLTLDL